MRAYGPDWDRVETACVLPSSALAAHFGGKSVFETGKARTLAQHLARLGATALTDGICPSEFRTYWLDASYSDGSLGGAWISERPNA